MALLGAETLGPLQLLLRLIDLRLVLHQVGLRLFQHGLGLSDGGLVGHRVDVRQYHVLFDDGIEIDLLALDILAETDDESGHLGADVDEVLRLQGSGGADGGGHVAPLDRRHAIHGPGIGSGVPGIIGRAAPCHAKQN